MFFTLTCFQKEVKGQVIEYKQVAAIKISFCVSP